MSDYADIALINSTFEPIEDEIDIEDITELLIEQLKDKEFTNADIYIC